MMKYFRLLTAGLMLAMFSGADQAEAASGNSPSKSSSTAAHSSSSKSRAGSVHKSARTYMKQAASKGYLLKRSSKNGGTALRNSLQKTLPATALYKGSMKHTIDQNPAGAAFFNYYFPYWMASHSKGFSAEQKSMLQTVGIREKDIIQPREKRYWLIIVDKHGGEKAVLVSKKQYDSVHKGDRIKVVHKRLIRK